jgi:hypothetical protein
MIISDKAFGGSPCYVGCNQNGNGKACSWVADGADRHQIWRVATNILNKKSRTADRGLSEELTTPHYKKTAFHEMLYRVSDLTDPREHSNEPSGSIKGGEFLDRLNDY